MTACVAFYPISRVELGLRGGDHRTRCTLLRLFTHSVAVTTRYFARNVPPNCDPQCPPVYASKIAAAAVTARKEAVH